MEKKPQPYVEITESDVKKVTLRFLKHYYRFRPRSRDAFISADMRGMGGIVADGYLGFPQDDGQLFIATFEATSADTRHEVQFSPHLESLNWDAWTVALLFVAIGRVLTHEMDLFVLNHLGPWWWWAGLFVLAFGLAMFFRFVAKPLRRYRYIHAVEQFKQYHADDQWIAISEHVFPGTEHVYFKELRRQCIKYGFGLVIIDQSFRPHLYITPAQHDVFHNRRASIEFVAQNDWLRQLQEHRYVGWLRRKAPWLFRGKDSGEPKRRFRRTHYHHMVVIGFCLLAIGGVYYRQWQERLVDYQEQEEYVMARLRAMQETSLEPMIYVLDSAAIWPFRKNMRPYVGDIWEEETDPDKKQSPATSQADVIVNIGNNEFALYDCSRFFNLGGKKYLIQEGIYPDLELASKRMYELSAHGLTANAIWAGCFQSEQEGYIVYLDELHNSLQEASFQADGIQDSLAGAEITLRLDIKVVYPNTGND
jgi:hypothetical protein